MRKHPELVKTDTIKLIDTVTFAPIDVDTVFISQLTDTLYLQKDRLHIQLIRHIDTIKVHAYVKPDTVIIKKNIPVEKVIVKKVNNKFNIYLFLAFIIVALLLFIKK